LEVGGKLRWWLPLRSQVGHQKLWHLSWVVGKGMRRRMGVGQRGKERLLVGCSHELLGQHSCKERRRGSSITRAS